MSRPYLTFLDIVQIPLFKVSHFAGSIILYTWVYLLANSVRLLYHLISVGVCAQVCVFCVCMKSIEFGIKQKHNFYIYNISFFLCVAQYDCVRSIWVTLSEPAAAQLLQTIKFNTQKNKKKTQSNKPKMIEKEKFFRFHTTKCQNKSMIVETKKLHCCCNKTIE